MNFLKNAKRLPVLDWNLTFFGAHEQTVNSDWRVPLEKHYAFECIYIIDGTEYVEFKNQTFNLEKGDCQRRCENVVFCRLKNAVFYR
ncbi:hypothetical protein ACFP1H_01785 [Secundilactobacillus hailunensis]|uniref:AraC family transcriptional regulator n=1 Tax=Secundilactobacillus hailunensis TaxID=2559923 RepID=A0ABW1T6W8_9LACO|nr:hypothetical protein [Secundilactobacillus hailunensis]